MFSWFANSSDYYQEQDLIPRFESYNTNGWDRFLALDTMLNLLGFVDEGWNA